MSTVQPVSMGTRVSTGLTRLPRAARRFIQEEEVEELTKTTKQFLAESFDLAVSFKTNQLRCVLVFCFL